MPFPICLNHSPSLYPFPKLKPWPPIILVSRPSQMIRQLLLFLSRKMPTLLTDPISSLHMRSLDMPVCSLNRAVILVTIDPSTGKTACCGFSSGIRREPWGARLWQVRFGTVGWWWDSRYASERTSRGRQIGSWLRRRRSSVESDDQWTVADICCQR